MNPYIYDRIRVDSEGARERIRTATGDDVIDVEWQEVNEQLQIEDRSE
jgi:hypothetical protein